MSGCIIVAFICTTIVSTCEISTFKNTLMAIVLNEYDVIGEDIIVNGCLGPSNAVSAYQIECKYQNIKILNKGAIANLSNTHNFIFNTNRIKKIEAGAFSNLSIVSKIDLSKNKLEVIKRDVFNTLVSLKELFLDENNINEIENEAFMNMVSLKLLSLKANKITRWNSHWFRNNFALSEIYFVRNSIELLPAHAFRGIETLQTIDLSQNELRDIDATTFQGIKRIYTLNLSQNKIQTLNPQLFSIEIIGNKFEGIQNLYLHRNNLTFLPQALLNDLTAKKNMMYINLHSNPWQCKCYEEIEDWATKKRIGIDVFNIGCLSKNNPVCVMPINQTEQCVEELNESLYQDYYSNYEEVSESDRSKNRNVYCFG